MALIAPPDAETVEQSRSPRQEPRQAFQPAQPDRPLEGQGPDALRDFVGGARAPQPAGQQRGQAPPAGQLRPPEAPKTGLAQQAGIVRQPVAHCP